MTENLTLTEFPPVSTAEWNAAVLKDQKGVAPKTKLYYRAEDLRGLEYLDSAPGDFPYTRGTRAGNDWSIRETVHDAAAAQAALDGGADEICFVLGGQEIDKVLDSLPLDRCAVHFEAGERAVEALEALIRRPVRGSIDYEPLADFERAAQFIRAAYTPEFKPVTVRAHRFTEAGAATVQELALALAEGVEMLARIPDVAPAMLFSFAVGPLYFLEIAKLRAARTLWARVVESFGGDPQSARMTVCARTAHWTKTVYSAHVNMLRATTAAMAAAIGGADALQVEPFDDTYRAPGETSRRLARNTQLILKREALLDRVADAAGGSYYLENLTDSLAKEAWALFQQIEAAGGFLDYSASGQLERDLAKSRLDREAAVGTRRTTILGTNQYPNPAARMLQEIKRADSAARPARIFEEIRLRTERYADRTGRTPQFLLLEAGDPKMRKARSGFIANFFGCGGFDCRISDTLSGDPDAVVLCSSDPEYAALAPRVIQDLRDAGKATPVIVAGNPVDSMEQLKQAGVAGFVHVRSNAAEVLRSWQDRLGVK
ncbi:MAG TPA: methylmalonyl-CoA mutase family protein [Bryobacteraceae bacterium]|nr:methylmalonyl-CoA mutase family protein [Bryobacteraceae bacterium]